MERGKEGAFKLYNLRFLPLFAALFILGIFLVKVSEWVAAILGITAILFIFLLWRTKSLKSGAAAILVAALLVGYGAASLSLYLRNEVGLTGYHEVTCRAIEVTAGEESYAVLADEIRAEGSSYGGKIAFETAEEITVGDRVTLSGEVSIKRLSLANIYTALEYRKGAKYAIEADDVSVESGTPPLAYAVREKVRALLVNYEGDRAGAFTYAMLFGDAEYMQDADKSAMREVGVAHVFAVSGLHVGVLAAAFLFLLRKLRVKDGISLLILLPIFGFYAYLVGFTPSVLRASIMVLVSLAASALGERYDGISALSFAAILILLVRPLYLFDVSFLMSFLSILGIHCLAEPIEKGFLRRRCKPWLASALALSLSTTIALIPVSATVFGRISLAGFALNILVVPLASLAYILTLIALLPTLVFPSFGALLGAISFLPLFIAELSGKVASLGLTASYEFSVVEIVLYYAILLFCGKYCLAKKKVKQVAGGTGAAILLILICI